MRPQVGEYNQDMERLFPEEGKVRSVTVQVTDACNLRCTYCYQIAKCNHIIDFETAKSYIKQVLDGDNVYINLENTSGMILDYIGGEPLLAIDLIQKLTDWTVEYMLINHHPWMTRFMINICSNGTLYFNEKVQSFLRQYGHMVSLTFSIDGNKELHDSCRIFSDGRGSYDMAVEAVKHYSAHYLNGHMPATKLTIAPENVMYFKDAHVNLIENLGYTHINCNCCFEEGWTIEHARILYHQMKDLTDWLFEHEKANDVYISIFETSLGVEDDRDVNWCGGTGEMISVDWKGDIYPCIRYMESSLGSDQPPIIIGNVKDGIATTCEQKECIKCLQAITRSSQSTKECMECPISHGCAWCSGYNYQKFGTVNKRATFICEMHKARVLANLYFWKRFAETYPDDQEKGCTTCNVPEEWAVAILGRDEYDWLINRLCQ